jgi:GNAT superfamily N-acetyltransferase
VSAPLRIEPLRRDHALDGFTCGESGLDRFLVRHALQAQLSNSWRTYLALSGDEPVGFYTLVVGQVEHVDAPPRVAKGMPRHPIPVLVLARLAVHKARQGQGLGAGLLLDALRRTLQVADIAGLRALLVHAKDEAAAAFYRHFGFEPSPTDPLHLFQIVKDIKLAAGEAD